MDIQVVFDAFLPLSVVASAGLLVWSNYQTQLRDREQRRKEIITNYLIDAYRKIDAACDRPDGSHHLEEAESAIADIQLFGSKQQIALVRDFMVSYSGSGDPKLILEEIRKDLRKEIGLESISSNLLFFRADSLGDQIKKSS